MWLPLFPLFLLPSVQKYIKKEKKKIRIQVDISRIIILTNQLENLVLLEESIKETYLLEEQTKRNGEERADNR